MNPLSIRVSAGGIVASGDSCGCGSIYGFCVLIDAAECDSRAAMDQVIDDDGGGEADDDEQCDHWEPPGIAARLPDRL
jgi:hypothetical protein